MHSTIDLSAHGAHYGHMAIPYSHNLGGWANLLVPIASLKNGSGPVVLCMAGNHGDEYPGQIAIMHLWRQLKLSDVKGQLILIPCLNTPAALNMTRLSPLDGKNFNRCFPGNPTGAVSEILAHFLSTELFPRAEVVIDLHTGGRSLTFVPTAHMHLVPAGPQRAAMLAATEAFLTDTAFLYADVAGTGLLPVEAERQGKIVVTTEMGGGEIVPASVHQLCQRGLRNVLAHLGVLNGDPVTRNKPARWVQSLDRDDYRFAPESGLYETCVDLGGEVREGDLLGRIHFIERPDRDAIEIAAHASGMLIAGRGPSIVKQGDCVAVIAHDTDPRTLP
ncbi:MAG: hypothetical protein FJW38_14390 [Acidobacteria bacterium]|nr:hypothetical protein [Acidobacteriota bacterium]